MFGDFDEDEDWEDGDNYAYVGSDEAICADCGRQINEEDLCGVCGAPMCFACFEMGAGVCRGPHK